MALWSPFASTVTETLEIPGSGGQSVTIRKLGWKALETAQGVAQAKGAAQLSALGGAAFLQELTALGGEAKVRQADPFLGFDARTMIVAGVVTWPGGVVPTDEQIDDMDPVFKDWLARAIFALSKPDTETDRKND
jgi:hypothetical protein